MQKSMACFATDAEKIFIVKLTNVMPFIIPLLTRVINLRTTVVNRLRELLPKLMHDVDDMPALWIIKQVENVVKERLTSGKRHVDLLQLMLDAATYDEIKVVLYEHVEITTTEKSRRGTNYFHHT